MKETLKIGEKVQISIKKIKEILNKKY